MLYTINKLKKYGFLVSMDDFGSGYSSLNSLKDMPLNILKLDAGFFRGEKDNERAEIVVSEILHLAKKLDMTTVAEGVDEQHQVDFLAAEGCNMIQGYYYSKPMPKEEYEAKMGLPAQVVREEAKVEEQAVEEAVEQEQEAAVEQTSETAPEQTSEAAGEQAGEPVIAESSAPAITMRRLEEKDAEEVSELIRTTISISNKKDYPEDIMDQLIAIETPEHVLERASWTHFYVAEKEFSEQKPAEVFFSPGKKDVYVGYMILANERIVERGTIELGRDLYRLTIPYDRSYGDGVRLFIWYARDGQICSESATLTYVKPEKQLKLSWSTFRDRLTAGQDETWTLQVLKDGKPAEASVMATLYDASLDKFVRHDWPFSLYFGRQVPSYFWANSSISPIDFRLWGERKSYKQEDWVFSHFDHSLFNTFGNTIYLFHYPFHLRFVIIQASPI